MSVATASPAEISALLANPDALQAAFDKKVQDDPAAVTKALADYMQDETTRTRMVEEAQSGLQAIHDIQQAFDRVYEYLAQIDVKNFVGSDGKVIQKFAPTWRGYSETFNWSLSQTETLAAKGKASIDTFIKSILPILGNTTMTVEAKKTRLNFYIKTMDQNNQNITAIDALVAVYQGISNDVSAFKATFEEKMRQVGARLTTDIQRAKDDIQDVKDRLKQSMETAKKLGIAGAVTGGIGGIMVATGVLAPVGIVLAIAGIVMGAKAIDEYFNKVKALKGELVDKEAVLARLVSQQDAYNKLSPAVAAASTDMTLIMAKLTVLTQVFKTVKNDIVAANNHLSFAKEADDLEIDDVRDTEIQLTAASYANLAAILNAFASGWSTAVKK
ncbi:hypothetical protein B0H12DRAFT_785062 [Mycena haematopus]|nr:hypothetical protein B0H12DRAFT_785062 [Mycena haematopus]